MASAKGEPQNGVFVEAMAFMNGPEYIVITGEGNDLEQALENSIAAADGQFEPMAEIVLASTSSESPAPLQNQPASRKPIKLSKPGKGGYRCTSALGTQLHGKSIENFDKTRQVYSKEELSPLPFQPPVFLTYATTMLSGAFKVFQYVITIMVALMVTQHAIERYWSVVGQVSNFQVLMFVIFLSYPLITLLLVILSNNEMCIRRFMYYRLLSLQIIVDWKNTPFYKLWFFAYFAVSFILINVYSLYAGVLTQDDKTSSVFPQWSIMVMQSLLLFMFWLNMVSMEDQLVPLNKVIENSPSSAKELITKCDVVSESSLKLAIKNVYKRKRAFKRMTEAAKDDAGRELLQTGSSTAAFFDLLTLRKAAKNRSTQDDVAVSAAPDHEEPTGCWLFWHELKEWCEDRTFNKLYAWYFCLEFYAVSMVRLHRSGKARSAASLWPYHGDTTYFMALGAIGVLCFLTVVAVEAYAVWFLLFSKDISDRDRYGILECKQCYQYHMQAGKTCSLKPAYDSCWSAAHQGLCAVQNALETSYGINATQVQVMGDTASCAPFLPAV